MFRIGAKLYRAARIGGSAVSDFRSPPTRFFSINNNVNTGFKTNPVALQMINYALSLARAQKSGIFFHYTNLMNWYLQFVFVLKTRICFDFPIWVISIFSFFDSWSSFHFLSLVMCFWWIKMFEEDDLVYEKFNNALFR